MVRYIIGLMCGVSRELKVISKTYILLLMSMNVLLNTCHSVTTCNDSSARLNPFYVFSVSFNKSMYPLVATKTA